MHVEVWHALAGVSPAVNHDPVTAPEKIQFFCDSLRREQQFTQHHLIGVSRFCQSRNHALRHHQHVNWSLRIQIVKRDYFIVFPHNIRWDLARRDLFKNCHAVD